MTEPQALLLPGEPCPAHAHVHVWLEPWLLLSGKTHETARLHIHSCDSGTPLCGAVQVIQGMRRRDKSQVQRRVSVWTRLWWHLTRSGPWYSERS